MEMEMVANVIDDSRGITGTDMKDKLLQLLNRHDEPADRIPYTFVPCAMEARPRTNAKIAGFMPVYDQIEFATCMDYYRQIGMYDTIDQQAGQMMVGLIGLLNSANFDCESAYLIVDADSLSKSGLSAKTLGSLNTKAVLLSDVIDLSKVDIDKFQELLTEKPDLLGKLTVKNGKLAINMRDIAELKAVDWVHISKMVRTKKGYLDENSVKFSQKTNEELSRYTEEVRKRKEEKDREDQEILKEKALAEKEKAEALSKSHISTRTRGGVVGGADASVVRDQQRERGLNPEVITTNTSEKVRQAQQKAGRTRAPKAPSTPHR